MMDSVNGENGGSGINFLRSVLDSQTSDLEKLLMKAMDIETLIKEPEVLVQLAEVFKPLALVVKTLSLDFVKGLCDNELYDVTAQTMKAKYDAYVRAGFTPGQAFELMLKSKNDIEESLAKAFSNAAQKAQNK